MKHIHPFPARMAPEIALRSLESLPPESSVLDPMSGSGMVLGTAARLGLSAVGFDLDPLACLISKVNGTFVDESKVRCASQELLLRCEDLPVKRGSLPWIDYDQETRRYIAFWFAPKQRKQLRILSYLLVANPFTSNTKVLNVLKIALSRLIVTKEPKASLARDAAHSRPHRTLESNDFNIFTALPKSVDHVLTALDPSSIIFNVKSYRGDARQMRRIPKCSVDCIMTSPPYLNAIDYMRGHRLSLVWLGYKVSDLRSIRARCVGAEATLRTRELNSRCKVLARINSKIDERSRQMVNRYYSDLSRATEDAFRTLKPGGRATYVIGNSTLKGVKVDNVELLMAAAKRSGFRVSNVYDRAIPENRRYLPMLEASQNSLGKRMRVEHVVSLKKAA